jgi:hypothetical protein
MCCCAWIALCQPSLDFDAKRHCLSTSSGTAFQTTQRQTEDRLPGLVLKQSRAAAKSPLLEYKQWHNVFYPSNGTEFGVLYQI